MPETPIQRLQGLLREMFQFDSADLDFGIYRLLHLKRREIEAFLSEQLPRQVDEAFASLAGQERAALQGEVEALAEQIKEQIAPDALSPTGEVREQYRASTIKVVKGLVDAYEEKRRRLQAAEATEARQAEVFNHLYNFFARYYEDGDFIPRRRYGAAESYAVPYDGQEVFFHWATRDMHYVKTAETLKDYAFTVEALGGPFRVRFVLVEASVPKDNVKGERRFFFPRPDLAAFDEAAREFHLPFEYRPPTEKEADKYGVNAKAQEAVSAEAVEPILEAVGDETLRATLAADQRTEQEKADDKPELPLILKRLRHFTKKQTSDFFIHKDLRGFLRRELEFYIKDQVLNLADIEGDFDAKRRMIRVLRRLGEDLIEFLSQIEDAQKRLFEKKKFIIETQYCITVGNIPEEFCGEIAACDAQWAEWKALFHIDEEEKTLFNSRARTKKTRRVAFLKAHPTLVLDTRHFDQGFVDRLLASFDDLDEITDGLLVHGENYQALCLLVARYFQQADFVYIDPPYNTDATPIIYKNDYKESCWLSLLATRLAVGSRFQAKEAALCIAIDDTELDRLGFLIRLVFFGHELFRVVVNHYPGSGTGRSNVTRTHEYAIFVVPPALDLLRGEPVQSGERERNFRRSGTGENNYRVGRPNSFYAVLVEPDTRRIVAVEPPPVGAKYPRAKTKEGYIRIYPIGEDGSERVWTLSYEGAQDAIARGLLRCTENFVVNRVYTDEERRNLLPSVWTETRFSAVAYGTNLLTDLFGTSDLFSYPKSLFTVDFAVEAATHANLNGLVLDYFAGSGTTGHAVIYRNRNDGGKRKFILVEMADYFDTVLLPRIKKVTFTPEWKDGKPKRMATAEEAERSPRIVKCVRLESYEDALHNLAADGTQERAREREGAVKEVVGEDEYRLKYLVRLPLEAAETMLSVGQLEHPFDYTLEILTDQGPRRRAVDLVETFNYLYGLRVRQLDTWINPNDKSQRDPGGRRYRVVRATDRDERRRILVIWRDMTGLDPARERAFLEEKIEAEAQAYDEVLINGDSAVPGAASLDGLFKRLMMAGEGQAP